MSYCRFGEGDVYLCLNSMGWHNCIWCSLHGKTIALWTPEEALAHLEEHRLAGDTVPERAFNRLRKEIEEEKKNEPQKS